MTTYTSSKGQALVISDMAFPYLKSAHAKLVREQQDDERQDEIDAMEAEIAKRDEAFAAEQEAQTDD